MSTSSAEARMEPTLGPGSEDRTGTIEAVAIPRDALGFISNNPEPAGAPRTGSGRFHAVDEKELKGFMQIGKAGPASLSALSLGVLIGFALSVFGIFQKAFSIVGLGGMADTLIIALCVLCLGISVIATVLSRRSRSKLSKTIQVIRKRPKV